MPGRWKILYYKTKSHGVKEDKKVNLYYQIQGVLNINININGCYRNESPVAFMVNSPWDFRIKKRYFLSIQGKKNSNPKCDTESLKGTYW